MTWPWTSSLEYLEFLWLPSDLWCPYLWSRLMAAVMWIRLMHMDICIPAHYICDVFKLGLCSCSNFNECLFRALILLMQRKYTQLCHNNGVTICHSIISFTLWKQNQGFLKTVILGCLSSQLSHSYHTVKFPSLEYFINDTSTEEFLKICWFVWRGGKLVLKYLQKEGLRKF